MNVKTAYDEYEETTYRRNITKINFFNPEKNHICLWAELVYKDMIKNNVLFNMMEVQGNISATGNVSPIKVHYGFKRTKICDSFFIMDCGGAVCGMAKCKEGDVMLCYVRKIEEVKNEHK